MLYTFLTRFFHTSLTHFHKYTGDDSDGEDFGGVDVWDSGVHAGGFEDGWAPPPATDGEQTYEDLCRAHIEAFINAAAAAQVL